MINKVFLYILFGSFLLTGAFASSTCFLIAEGKKVLKQIGDCKQRHSPCSTFKITLSLMGYDDGFLVDENHPCLPFKEGYVEYIDAWKQPHNPTMWMKNSCVWYSQVFTQHLGMDKFKYYLKKFDYGNQDVSGDKGQNNGLSRSWLSSSLKISAEEQVAFLQKLVEHKIPVSPQAHEMTQKILFLDNLENGWKFYGKTGGGHVIYPDGTHNKDLKAGWFIGWVQKENRTLVFARFLEDTTKNTVSVGKRAKEDILKELMPLIQ